MKCKCGCGQDVDQSDSSGRVYVSPEHRFRFKVLNPETRTGNYSNHRRKDQLLEPIKRYLDKYKYPHFVSRTSIAYELQESHQNMNITDIKYHVSRIITTLGYERRNRHSYVKVKGEVKDAISN